MCLISSPKTTERSFLITDTEFREDLKIYVIKTNSMHYLSSIYFVNQPLHVSGISVAHHQEVYCVYTTVGTCCAFS